jgi:hypothetical protein
MAIISPEPGKNEEVGQQIFAVVETNAERLSVTLVQEGPSGMSFELPDELYDRWMEKFGPTPKTESADEPPPARRGPGRPRKNPLPEQE